MEKEQIEELCQDLRISYLTAKQILEHFEGQKKLDLDLVYKAVKFAYDATDLMQEDTYNIRTALSHALNELTENGGINGTTESST